MTTATSHTNDTAKKTRSAGMTVFLRSIPIIVIAIIFAVVIGSSYVPSSASACTVTGHGIEPGGKGADTLIVESSCGDYHTDIPESEFVIGSTYDFALKGIHKPNIAEVTPAD